VIESEFLTDALMDWRENGKAAFTALAEQNPHDYLRLIAEVGRVIAKQTNEQPTIIDARPVFDIGSILGAIASGAAGRSEQRTLPDRSLLALESGAEPGGRAAPVDSGSVRGSPRER
jgi:hypothetical protein